MMIDPGKKSSKKRVDELSAGSCVLNGAFSVALHGTTKHWEESTVIERNRIPICLYWMWHNIIKECT